MNALKQLFSGNTRQFGMIFALAALIVLFQILTDGLALTPTNVQNLFNGNSYVLILAIGMVLVIIAGHIDLSVGSVAAFAGIVVAIAMRDLRPAVDRRRAARPGRRRADRCLAGLLGRLRRDPGVHRDPGRHAAVPRRQPVRRQVEHHPGAGGLLRPRRRLPARDRAQDRLQQPDPGDRPAGGGRGHPADRPPASPRRQGRRHPGPDLGRRGQDRSARARSCSTPPTCSPPVDPGRPSRSRASSSPPWSCSTASCRPRPSSAGTCTRWAATSTRPSCPVSAASGSTSWS